MSQDHHQSKIVDLIAILTAKPGKAERVCTYSTADDKY